MTATRLTRLSAGQLRELALALDARRPKVISPSTVRAAAWVRWKCQFGCGGFGSSLMCPPHTPTPDQTAVLLAEYRRAVLFEAKRGKAKSIATALERELFLAGCHRALGLGAGPCLLCKTCTLRECRHPDDARPSMEACGIDVFSTVRRHGFTIEVVRTRRDP